MTALDPLHTLWDALERRDCDPHGDLHNFRARCPAHQGANREALHVTEGCDRRALLHCFAHGCDPDRIVAALDLTTSDLFPAGHRRGRRRPMPAAKRTDLTGAARAVADVLAALEVIGHEWQA